MCCYQHRKSRSLFLSGNKRDRMESLTQFADWSQLVADYFFFGDLTQMLVLVKAA